MKLIVVSGAIANKPLQGGEAWVRLSYVLGLRRLGYAVHLLEHIQPENCFDGSGRVVPFEDSVNRRYFVDVTREFGLADCSSLVPAGREAAHAAELDELADGADALLNISGHFTVDPWFSRFRRKALIDIDPGFTQIWHAAGNPAARVVGHDHYFTIGESIGSPECQVPTGGIPWTPTRPPVVMEHWTQQQPIPPNRFTTIANWRGSYGPVEYAGEIFGQKVHQFRRFIELPSHRPETFEIALAIHPDDHKDRAALEANRWQITDPRAASSTPERFREYVQRSSAEFSVAQGMYVQTQCGWFSDRTTRYLASGRPALVQDTGFSRHLPAGEGLVPFRTFQDAVNGAALIADDYERHSDAARQIAESCFDSDRVIGRLMEQIGVGPS